MCYNILDMLNTSRFLNKSSFFNTFCSVVLMLVSFNIFSQNSEHGARFELDKDIQMSTASYDSIKSKDSLNIQMKGTITDVCQAKGCWMKVNLADNNEVFVRFKDYGFFVPTDSAGKEVVINGLAFVEEMSVEDQRHYATDKGAGEEEIQKITQPKRTLHFEASGVRISER